MPILEYVVPIIVALLSGGSVWRYLTKRFGAEADFTSVKAAEKAVNLVVDQLERALEEVEELRELLAAVRRENLGLIRRLSNYEAI